MLRSLSVFGSIRRSSPLLSINRFGLYESDLSLKQIYLNSRLDLHTPAPPAPPREDDKFDGFIPMNKIKVTYSRSSGPGGQNVNKLSTKVDLRFHVNSAEWIPENVRNLFLIKYKNQITKEGYYVVKSDVTRSQHMNLADALERVRNNIRELEAELEPKPELSPERLAYIQQRREKAARERIFWKRMRSRRKSDRNFTFDI